MGTSNRQYNLVTKSNKSHLESINRRRTHSNNSESVRRPTCSETIVAVDLVRANRRVDTIILFCLLLLLSHVVVHMEGEMRRFFTVNVLIVGFSSIKELLKRFSQLLLLH
jgi:hypothetical protein